MTPESKRHDPYAALSALLGADNADTLMDYLPPEPGHRPVTTGDLDPSRCGSGRGWKAWNRRWTALISEWTTSMDRFEERMDRLFLALIAGTVAIVATLITAFFVV